MVATRAITRAFAHMLFTHEYSLDVTDIGRDTLGSRAGISPRPHKAIKLPVGLRSAVEVADG